MDTIMYHTWPGTPYEKVTKTQENITHKKVKGSGLFPAHDHKAARKRHSSITKTNTKYKLQQELRQRRNIRPLAKIYIPIKFYEDIPNSYRVMGRTRTFAKRWGKIKGYNLKSKYEGTIVFAHNTLSWPSTHSYKISLWYPKRL